MSATQPAASPRSPIRTCDIEQELEEVIANAQEWLDTPHSRFEGRPPRALLHTDEERRLRELVESVKHGLMT
jgi:uncharacterized protein (DUF2384 family)